MSGTGAPASASGLACTLTGWVPGSGRPAFATTGISALSTQRVRGGYDFSACAHGSYSLKLVSRAPAGLSCAAALAAGTPARAGARFVVVAVRESARAESRCAGRITLTRDGRRIGARRFALNPAAARRVRIRTTGVRPRGSIRLTVTLTGVDVDANRFRRAFHRRLRGA
jgi:hypothetical protein